MLSPAVGYECFKQVPHAEAGLGLGLLEPGEVRKKQVYSDALTQHSKHIGAHCTACDVKQLCSLAPCTAGCYCSHASQVPIAPNWQQLLQHAVPQAASGPDTNDTSACSNEAQLYKLLVLEQGGHFTHQDTKTRRTA